MIEKHSTIQTVASNVPHFSPKTIRLITSSIRETTNTNTAYMTMPSNNPQMTRNRSVIVCSILHLPKNPCIMPKRNRSFKERSYRIGGQSQAYRQKQDSACDPQ